LVYFSLTGKMERFYELRFDFSGFRGWNLPLLYISEAEISFADTKFNGGTGCSWRTPQKR
jgi:hypothetical protein